MQWHQPQVSVEIRSPDAGDRGRPRRRGTRTAQAEIALGPQPKLDDRLEQVHQHPPDHAAGIPGDERPALPAALEERLHLTDGVALGMGRHRDERLEEAIAEPVGQDLFEDHAPTRDESGLVVPRPHSEAGIQQDVEPATEQPAGIAQPADGRAPALHHVGVAEAQLAVQAADVFRLVLEIGVDETDVVRGRPAQPGPPGGDDALVGRVPADDHEGVGRRQPGHDLSRRVAAAVVDQDQLADELPPREQQPDTLDQLGQVRRLVVTRRDDAQLAGRPFAHA